MYRVLVSVEGQTEEIFVRDILAPHLVDYGVAIEQVILKTKRPAGAAPHRGGMSTWAKVERELRILLSDSNAAMITTMYDLYGLPSDAPGRAGSRGIADPHRRAAVLEAEIQRSLADDRLCVYLQVHEFEAMLFAAPDEIAARAGKPALADSIAEVTEQAGGPELVDDSPQTAPSKRLVAMWSDFIKTLDGPAIVKAAGLAVIRSQCPHLDGWIAGLERVGDSRMT